MNIFSKEKLCDKKVSNVIKSVIKRALGLVKTINLFSKEYPDPWNETVQIRLKEIVLDKKCKFIIQAYLRYLKHDVLLVRINEKEYRFEKTPVDKDSAKTFLPYFEFLLMCEIKNNFASNTNMNSFLICLMTYLKECKYEYWHKDFETDTYLKEDFEKHAFLKELIVKGNKTVVPNFIPSLLRNLLSYQKFFSMLNNAVALICNTVYDYYHNIFGVHRERLSFGDIVNIFFEITNQIVPKMRENLIIFGNVSNTFVFLKDYGLEEQFEIMIDAHLAKT